MYGEKNGFFAYVVVFRFEPKVHLIRGEFLKQWTILLINDFISFIHFISFIQEYGTTLCYDYDDELGQIPKEFAHVHGH